MGWPHHIFLPAAALLLTVIAGRQHTGPRPYPHMHIHTQERVSLPERSAHSLTPLFVDSSVQGQFHSHALPPTAGTPT